MDLLDIEMKALERWQERNRERAVNEQRIKEGKIVAVESPERVQLRLDRLAAAASETKGLHGMPNHQLRRIIDREGVERIIDKNDLIDANFFGLGQATARFTGRIVIRQAAGVIAGYGTGFMVSPRLLMTNNHVLRNAEEAQPSLVEFDYDKDLAGRPMPVVTFELDPDTFFLTDKTLDFTLVAVKELSQDGASIKNYGWIRLIRSEGKVLLGEPLNIIQHPNGKIKKIAFRGNLLVDLFDDYLHYLTDTERGSSGAAVLNDQWELVALHHSGVPKTDRDGNLVDIHGRIWRQGMDAEQLAYVANEGIRVSSLVKHISAQTMPPAQDRVRRELLDLEPPPAIETALSATRSAFPGARPDGPSRAKNPSASVTIPLTITVQLGSAPTLQYSVSGFEPAAVPADDKAAQTAPGDQAKEEAFAALEAARNRKYYDKEADAANRIRYYQGVSANGRPRETYTALSALLAETHTTRLPYSPSRHVYPWVDLHDTAPERTLRSIYSGKSFSPAQLIENDFAIEREREAVREAMHRPGILGAESIAAGEDFLEASLPYNCEHVVPQSWFGKREPMRGDLHHLFACESGCNSFRGNIPYFDFDDYEEAVRSACGKREEGRFEPGAGKGAVARATLYFLLRYPGQINQSPKEYTAERIDILLRWHDQYPPDDYERHRNMAIFELQGNRNPLIDHPDWGAKIDFKGGLG
jgi:endonuclease G